MRIVTAVLLVASVGTMSFGQSNTISMERATSPAHFVPFSPSLGATLRPGALIDMSRLGVLAKDSMLLDCKASDLFTVSQTSVAVVTREDRSSAAQQVVLAVEASVGLLGSGNVNISSEELSRIRQNALYARLDIIDGVRSLEGRPKWPADWKLSKEEEPQEVLKSFISDYGSHYVYKLYYGRTISMKVTMREQEQKRRDDLEAKLRAGFLTFSLNADYAKKSQEELADYQFDLLISVQGGEADRAERLLIRNFKELETFIKEFREGQFKIASTPVAADLRSLSGLTGDEVVDRALRGDVQLVARSSIFGDYQLMEANQVHKAQTDGFVIAFTTGPRGSDPNHGYILTVDGLPVGHVDRGHHADGAGADVTSTWPVKKGASWELKTFDRTGEQGVANGRLVVRWIPVNN